MLIYSNKLPGITCYHDSAIFPQQYIPCLDVSAGKKHKASKSFLSKAQTEQLTYIWKNVIYITSTLFVF